MRHAPSRGCLRRAIGAAIALSTGATSCLERPVTTPCPEGQRGLSEVIQNSSIEKLDLLVAVDNSGSMEENQANIMAQLGPLIDQLTNPRCLSRSVPGGGALHECSASNPDDVPQYPAVQDVHVGVITTDLGTPGFRVAGCDDTDRGDDGRLNPIRNGFAMQAHLPWAPRRPDAAAAPPGFRPAACANDINQFPSFITFCSNAADLSCDVAGANATTRDPLVFADWFKCNAGIYVNGCGLEAQLESVWRALIQNDARAIPGNAAPNAGFVREDALLAIVMLSDEEDGSVRDCDHDNGFSAAMGGSCTDAKDVYDTASGAWADATNLDLRFYRYTPGDARDPTWNLDRYVNTVPATPANAATRWNKDLLSLKPGHPERIIFAAIAGVPLNIQTTISGGNTVINWDSLLGAPGPRGADDFYGRDSRTAAAGMQQTAGPFSMRAANMDPACAHVVPACRREGSTYDPSASCSSSQYMAFPSRRIVEIARRFDEAPLCNGQPCRSGVVTSICSTNFGAAIRLIVQRLSKRLLSRCLARVLERSTDSAGDDRVPCVALEALPLGMTACDPARGRRVPALPEDRTWISHDGVRTVCEIDQLATDPVTRAPVSEGPGWYYDTAPDPQNPTCGQRFSYTREATPGFGTEVRFECVQDTATRCR